MPVSRPVELRVDDEVQLAAGRHTVISVSGTEIVLEDVIGSRFTTAPAELFTMPGFSIMSTRAPLPPQGLLDGLSPEVIEQVRWWESHIVEVLTGKRPDHTPTCRIKPEYDPSTHTLRQRELAKVAELSAAGHQVALRTFQRQRRNYESDGLWGLVDGRLKRKRSPRTDDRVVDAIRKAITQETDRSTGTGDRLRRSAERILTEDHGLDPAEVMPSRATFYRLEKRLTAGKHTHGSARTRRSLAKQPDGPFGTVSAFRPGEWMQIDSTPFNVRVALDNGLVDRVELTWMVDLATRTIPAAVLRPSTKAVDAALLLARSLTPEAMRPGWKDALRMSRSVLPHRRLVGIDQRLEHAAARPVIVPETIVFDHGMVYMSQTFRNACRSMGINPQPTHKGSPWEKGTVETSFSSVDTLFAQYIAGFVGNSVENRGKDADQQAVWSLSELQELLDEWIVAHWQNRPHDGLRHPLIPGKSLTPNEAYAAAVETAGYVPVPLAENDYVELLPATWRAINSYGIKIYHRKYDCKALSPYRREHSGVEAKRGLWEVHLDPYDVSRIWVRNHRDGGWIQAPWTHLTTGTPRPFGEQAWDHSRQILARRGTDKPTEAEISQSVAELLDRAEKGPAKTPASKKDQRVAARTRSVSAAGPVLHERTPPQPQELPPPPPAEANDDTATEDEELAKVIPLGVFDAREEAKKWW
jgi:putative transposase